MGLGFKTFVSGVLSSADVQGYLMQQVVITCTSGARPASPVVGMTIFETDTLIHRTWSGTGWDNLPGYQYGVSSTAGSVFLASLGVAVAVDSSCKVTVTTTSQRRFRVFVQAAFSAASGAPSRYTLTPAYTAGAAVGAITAIGSNPARIPIVTASSTGIATGVTEQDVVLAAGTWTFYPVATRDLGGSATDVSNSPLVRVVDAGPS